MNYAEMVTKNLGCTTLHGQLTFKSTAERWKQKETERKRQRPVFVFIFWE